MKQKKREGKTGSKWYRRVVAFVLLLGIWTLLSWIPVTERIELSMPMAGKAGIRIALLSDLHSCYYGKNQKWLIDRVTKENPDLVILAGDIFDDKLPDRNAELTLRQLADLYPCYYVTGNHEYWSGRAEEMKEKVKAAGVTVLAGDCSSVDLNGAVLDICGVDDPDEMTEEAWKKQLDSAYEKTDPSHIRILVSHRPEQTKMYENYDFDLILAGHAHAGQFRIPGLNRGLFAPDQGLFAEYVNGLYTLSNGSIMEVSRGLAHESTPAPRLFNQPEVVILELKDEGAG